MNPGSAGRDQLADFIEANLTGTIEDEVDVHNLARIMYSGLPVNASRYLTRGVERCGGRCLLLHDGC